jgi:hypothetical protein
VVAMYGGGSGSLSPVVVLWRWGDGGSVGVAAVGCVGMRTRRPAGDGPCVTHTCVCVSDMCVCVCVCVCVRCVCVCVCVCVCARAMWKSPHDKMALQGGEVVVGRKVHNQDPKPNQPTKRQTNPANQSTTPGHAPPPAPPPPPAHHHHHHPQMTPPKSAASARGDPPPPVRPAPMPRLRPLPRGRSAASRQGIVRAAGGGGGGATRRRRRRWGAHRGSAGPLVGRTTRPRVCGSPFSCCWQGRWSEYGGRCRCCQGGGSPPW